MSACQHCGREHPVSTPTCPLTGDSLQQPGAIGQRIDRYQVERLLGAGGFGAVYQARHVHTDALVALKVLKRALGADRQMIERFLREARAAAAVGSEHIVRVLDAGLAPDGQAFLALELLDGMDLKELASREGPLPPMRVALIVLQVLEGLGEAHARGIVHRDMKPANVFIVRRRDASGVERDFVKLLDFGISKMHGDAAGSGLTMTGMAMGTPSYMAPEQFFDAKNVDQRADLYSVAALLYELLSGRLPFDAESYAHLIVKVRTEHPEPLMAVAPHVPAPLAQVVTAGLAREPHQRWQSAAEMAVALRSALPAQGPGQAPPRRAELATPLPARAPPMSAAPAPLPAATGPAFDATHTPARSAPPGAPSTGAAPGGWVGAPAPAASAVPSAPGPAAAPSAAPTQAPPRGGTRWGLIILGLLLLGGGCCTCTAVLGAASENAAAPDTAAASDTAE